MIKISTYDLSDILSAEPKPYTEVLKDFGLYKKNKKWYTYKECKALLEYSFRKAYQWHLEQFAQPRTFKREFIKRFIGFYPDEDTFVTRAMAYLEKRNSEGWSSYPHSVGPHLYGSVSGDKACPFCNGTGVLTTDGKEGECFMCQGSGC